ncbi:MAG: YjbH domain-containing protein, partial [Alphaproteobacteria bacterium]|nr:YjbH domain-containing protein [Alphaproteobacteria bacterium]
MSAQTGAGGFYEPSASDFGGMGLFQTRNARFARDGNFEVGFSKIYPYERYLLTLQALPWLEATFRYTSVTNRNFAGGQGTDFRTSFKDRGFDLKFQLLEEGRFRPAVALGLQDGLGTGVFSGEYLVASKRYHDFDFSLGLGWGYNAGSSTIKNPLGSLSNAFKSRGSGAQQGGTVLVANYLSGPTVGLTAGIEYTTPIKGLVLKVEYDPNNYAIEPLANPLVGSSHYNFGILYRPFPWIDLSLARERGEEYMVRIGLRANFNDPGIPKFDPPAPIVKPRSVPEAAQEAGEIGTAFTSMPYSPAQLPKAQVGLERALRVEALETTWTSIGEHEVSVGLDSSSERDVRLAAQVASAYLSDADGYINVIEKSGQVTRLSNAVIQRELPVNFLFDEIERAGIEVASVDLVGDTLTISVAPAVSEKVAHKIASLAGTILPIATVKVVRADGQTASKYERQSQISDSSGRDPVRVALLDGEVREARGADQFGAASGETGSQTVFSFDEEMRVSSALFADAAEQNLAIDG